MSIELLARTYMMIECLAEAGRKIQRQDKEINQLKEANEKLRNGEYAINLAPHIGGLKERIQQLEWELEALRNGKKVELPLEVAEAINTCRATGLDDYQILSLQAVINQLFRDYPEPVLNALESIRKFAVQQPSNAEILLSALANGYIVVPVPEKDEAAELLAGVTTIVQKWWFEAPDGRTAKSHSDQLAKDICNYIKQREDDKPPF